MVWYAVAALESMLTVMTGRPTMINPRDCSVNIPREGSAEDSSAASSLPDQSHETSTMDFGTQKDSPSVSDFGEDSNSSSLNFLRGGPLTLVAATFFMHYTDICALSKEVVGELYQPGVRSKKWSEIKTMILDYDKRLLTWRNRLTSPFDNADISPDRETESCRVALRIAFHSARTIINRPCLCRLDQLIADQSIRSKETNRDFANKCVDSARAVLRLVLYKPDSIILRGGATWWMLLHHLKRALTVSLLELAFRAEQKPSDADEILMEAKDAIEWLRWHSASSPTARRTWVTMSRLVQLAAKKVGGDTVDISTAHDSSSSTEYQTHHHHHHPQQPQQSASGMYATDSFGGPYGGAEEQYLGDAAERSELDQFGFLREEGGMGSFFPTASEIERIGQGEGDEMQMQMGEYEEDRYFDFSGQGRGGRQG